MVIYKYGEFEDNQFDDAIKFIRKKIFYLLLLGDETSEVRKDHVDVQSAFYDMFHILDGLNEILFYPEELVTSICLLHEALCEYMSPDFDFDTYRKLVLDAGNELFRVKGVVERHAEP